MANIPFMSGTDFATLMPERKLAWAMDFWKEVRNDSFLTKFLGSDNGSIIQRVTELKKSEKGDRAMITLVPNAAITGVSGDNTLLGKEDKVTSEHVQIQIDQYRVAMADKGRMDNQRTILNFREVAKDQLAYGYAKLTDEVAFLTLSGIPYTSNTDGSTRVGGELSLLSFAADVSVPTAKRHIMWDATNNKLVTGNTATITANDKITYKALVRAKSFMVQQRIRGTGTGGSQYHVFVDPQSMANLKLDPDFLANLRAAAAAIGNNSEIFKGGIPTVDGLIIHENMYTYHTLGASTGSKWGATGNVDGARCLIVGAQALGYADIGAPEWNEETQDYGNINGISIGKIFGFRKPKFKSSYSNSVEDYGVVAFDVAL